LYIKASLIHFDRTTPSPGIQIIENRQASRRSKQRQGSRYARRQAIRGRWVKAATQEQGDRGRKWQAV
jgi:hypothetical protein